MSVGDVSYTVTIENERGELMEMMTLYDKDYAMELANKHPYATVTKHYEEITTTIKTMVIYRRSGTMSETLIDH